MIDVDSGVALVVTDLHGEGRVYDHLRDLFLSRYQAGTVQRLILCGDLIHSYGPEAEDDSLRMLLDVMRLQAELGPEAVVLLMGNHEMPHVYGIHLMKGKFEFTPRFEQALVALDNRRGAPRRRHEVLAFLRGLPLYVRTRAGVMLSHAGAPPGIDDSEAADFVLNFDHDALLRLIEDRMRSQYDLDALKQNAVYLREAKKRLAIDGADDPRLPELLRAELVSQTSVEFQLLWQVLFATNEQDSSLRDYSQQVRRFLQAVSAISPHEQRVLIAGHIPVSGGYATIGQQQLRLASYAHASPRHEGCYVLLDCARPVQSAVDLLPQVHKTFARD
ncbi:MAG: metallophosphoesterase [Anaerolineae bacterium]|nr:metallophosphoesterase [Anaerolineae bacterium]